MCQIREDGQGIAHWFRRLPSRTWDEAIPVPAHAVIVSAGMVTGVRFGGAPASPRVAALIRPVTELFRLAHARGVRRFLLVQDVGTTRTREGRVVPTPYLQETEEGATIGELRELPFANTFTLIRKTSRDQAIGTDIEAWLRVNPDLQTVVIVGNCTDLWMYQMATYLWLRACALKLPRYQVVVPADMVRTGDLSQEAARQRYALAHPDDLFHQAFLYYLSQNNVEVLRALEESPGAAAHQPDGHSARQAKD